METVSSSQQRPDNPAGPESSNDLSEAVYSGATRRIQRCMLLLSLSAPLACWFFFGWRSGLGLLCGCIVAILNFHWLKAGVEGLADRITLAGKPASGKGIVFRFLLRYVLMGVIAYGILSVSPASLYGLLFGLSLPVAAIACEAAYEAYVALVRGL